MPALMCGGSGSMRGVSGCDGTGGKDGKGLGCVPCETPAPGPCPFRADGPRAYPRPCGNGPGAPWYLTIIPALFPQVIRANSGSASLDSLDFFGHKEGAPEGSAEEGWGLAGAGEEDGAGESGGKRKRAAESGEGKRKKKKTRGIHIYMFTCVCASLVGNPVGHSTRKQEGSGFIACARADK